MWGINPEINVVTGGVPVMGFLVNVATAVEFALRTKLQGLELQFDASPLPFHPVKVVPLAGVAVQEIPVPAV